MSADLKTVHRLPQPVHKVSLRFEPTASTPMTDLQKSLVRSSLTSALSGRGVQVTQAGSEGVCAVEGSIDRYHRGSRALRYFMPAGFGYFGSSWHVVDGSGVEIGECRIDGSVRGGATGGSYESLVDEVGERLADCLLLEGDQ
jgi:hypothetical protein